MLWLVFRILFFLHFCHIQHCVFKKNTWITSYEISGDEILAVNGKSLCGASHQEAITVFKQIKYGPVLLQIGRRVPKKTAIINW